MNTPVTTPGSLLLLVELSTGNLQPVFTDFALLVIGALLLATIVGYLTGMLPYPFGIIVLSVLFFARLLSLPQDKR